MYFDSDSGPRPILLIEIANPNPRRLGVWQGDVMTACLESKDKVLVPYLLETRLTYESGVALVVCEVKDADEEPWIQKVGTKPVYPDRKLAVDEKDVVRKKKRPPAEKPA